MCVSIICVPTLGQVFEFTAFRERLANAHTLAVVRAEAAVTDCLRGTTASSSNSGGSGAGGAGSSGVPAMAPSSGDFSGWEAMRAAAVAAAVALPTHELPTAGEMGRRGCRPESPPCPHHLCGYTLTCHRCLLDHRQLRGLRRFAKKAVVILADCKSIRVNYALQEAITSFPRHVHVCILF